MIGLQIQTTPFCTSKCVICPHAISWLNKTTGIMTDRIFNKILIEISSFKFKKICPYLMNEPLTDPKIFKRIEKIKNLNNFDYLEISTNASLLDDGYANQLINILNNVNNEVWISFHGTNENNYKKIMELDFHKTLKNICNFLVKADNKLKNIQIKGAGQPFIRTKNSPFYFSKKEYYNFWEGQFRKLKLKNKPKLFYFQYNDRAGNIRKKMSFNFKRKSLKNFKCERINQWFHILYTGELVLCCNDYNKEVVLGDITKQSLKKILDSSKRKKIINMVEGIIKSPQNFICKRCTLHLC